VIEDMGISVYLDTEITDDLRLEGLMRDVVRRIQTMRKEMDLKFDQPIEVGYEADGDLKRAIEEYRDYIAGEVQARSMAEGPVNGEEREWTVEGMRLRVWVRPL
jgi:isoleucyl-tRNA synthetase